MSIIVRTTTRVVSGFILIFGCYVLAYGHRGPGGGFAFGVIVALALLLVLLAFGREVAKRFIHRRVVALAAGFSVLAFLIIGLLGYLGTKAVPEGSFFLQFLPKGEPFQTLSGGTALLADLAVGVMLAAVIFGVLTSLSLFHGRQRPDTSEPIEDAARNRVVGSKEE
jgi:multicomponent Na+:H+ antiporter subunit B